MGVFMVDQITGDEEVVVFDLSQAVITSLSDVN